MSGEFLLDWAGMAVSLFNTMVLVWLGVTVFLNAERRSWGVWLATAGLLCGAAFFISHSAILGQDISQLGTGLNFWWHVGWGPVIAAPFAWYVLMLWYAGFWDDRTNALVRRQRVLFVLTVLLTLTLGGLLLFGNPLPSLARLAELDFSESPSISGIPLLVLVYPETIFLCIILALDALLHPVPSGRRMGDLARRRARPWLVGASLMLLAVSLLVGGVIVWLVEEALQETYTPVGLVRLTTQIAWFDLMIASLISVAILLIGRAVVSYEVFTGKTLPRRGLIRHWHTLVVVAAGSSLLVAWALTIHLRPVYTQLLVLCLMTIFFAYFFWRSYLERENAIRQIRPFVTSQRLYDQFLGESHQGAIDLDALFQALVVDVLGVKKAFLLPMGALIPLAGSPLMYPATGSGLPAEDELRARVVGLLAKFTPLQTTAIPVDEASSDGLTWCVPLWSEHGLAGVLLLGDKQDGGFYSQEEIEVARSSGERLMDSKAAAVLAHRLATLERQHMMESQVVDRQTRRVLHDEVLPRLHTALLQLSSAPQTSETQETMTSLSAVHRQIADLLRDLPAGSIPEVSRLGLVQALHRVIEVELEGTFDAIRWEIEKDAEERLRGYPALTQEVLYFAAREALRNAARYARPDSEPAVLSLIIRFALGPALTLLIEDNGVGFGEAHGEQGTGQGLALHSTLLAVVGGTMAIESLPGRYTRVLLTLPLID